MQNYGLLEVVGKLNKPVLLKRGLSSTLDELLQAADYILKEGNERLMLCERGIRTFDSAMRFTLDLGAVPWLKLHTHLPVIVDPSHASGDRRLVGPLSRAAAAVGADGIIVEVAEDPEVALCDGPQQLYAADFAEFAAEVAAHAQLAGRSSPERRTEGGGRAGCRTYADIRIPAHRYPGVTPSMPAFIPGCPLAEGAPRASDRSLDRPARRRSWRTARGATATCSRCGSPTRAPGSSSPIPSGQAGLHRRPAAASTRARPTSSCCPSSAATRCCCSTTTPHMAQRKLMLPPFHGERMRGYGRLMADVAAREIERWPRGRAGARSGRPCRRSRSRSSCATVFGVARRRRGSSGCASALRAMLAWAADAAADGPARAARPARGSPSAGRCRRALEPADELIYEEIRAPPRRARPRRARRRALAAPPGPPRGRRADERRGAARRAR